jgi:O-antigen/teichoic acid export membrane protein
VTEEKAAYRQIIRSTSIIGGSSALNILIGIARSKAIALLLGPAGVGISGLYQSLISTAAAIAALGVNGIGARELAEASAKEDQHELAKARQTLFGSTLIQGIAGAILVWLFREPISRLALNDDQQSHVVGWLAIGVALTVASGAQIALLQGMRRIRDIAAINVASSICYSIVGVAIVWIWRLQGLVLLAVIGPVFNFAFGWWYTSKLNRAAKAPLPLAVFLERWKSLIKIGTSLMLAGFAAALQQLILRAWINHHLGSTALGDYQAAATLANTYLTFLLSAMTTDYYPRLCGVIADHRYANEVVNQQTEVALLLGGPVILAVFSIAPWVISAFYSQQFTSAATILRWQLAGDIGKLAAWPLGFIILASGDGRTFLITEVTALAAITLATILAMPLVGLPSTGLGYLFGYVIYLPLMYWLAARRTGFAWKPVTPCAIGFIAGAAALVVLLDNVNNLAAAVVGLACSFLLAGYSAKRLANMAGTPMKLRSFFRRLFQT